ncbi:uncharacterized protein C8Q71DRAFT_46576 [Rhodofomes roseus]|uniref:Uncharacterized protein n=1 Tax=Rhodofomes roseus TaxID=34475 RepID=A0ABQ8KFH1_9APHY|nr:uncharacterized protein C8Q71DRAFT_46576 [Rhodofomes roseus]KAH9836529.1 hypothetical protein C8Q71DRAFT_46576 [Rhodofomes roseus]
MHQNLVQGVLVNGTRGRIEEFITEEEAETRSIKSARLPPPPPPPPPSPTPSAEEVDYTPPNRKPHIVLRHGSFDALDGLWPLVKFETGDMLLCDDCSFDVKNTEGKTEAVRDQVSHILSFNLSYS